MTLLAILLVIWPLWRLSKLPSHPSATASQVDFFRSQQQQLIEEHRQDGLNIKDYQLARAELVSSLLDTVPTPEISHSFRPSYKLTLLVVIVLPLMAISWYLQMGASDALRQQWSATQQANLAQEAMAQYGSMANLTAALLAKVKQQPNDARGWYLLAKLYVSQEQYSQALTAYQRANQLQPGQKTSS
ncbi:MAG: c-type cytochrome biogenesis protein CcmI [Coxiellaceae bacterium]|nr:MAG: c-type cytochrome biogenesis protein CcmI [Coxiellaceae bacterium]